MGPRRRSCPGSMTTRGSASRRWWCRGRRRGRRVRRWRWRCAATVSPRQILTDNGKVFTGRFGPGTGEVLFDRICRENGIKHLLTAPRSPTTTGKVERFHRTLRERVPHRPDLRRSSTTRRRSSTGGSSTTTTSGPHQGIGMVPPVRTVPPRRRRAGDDRARRRPRPTPPTRPESRRRRVASNGRISFASTHYLAGVWLAGETVEVICDGRRACTSHHRGVLVATHARRHKPAKRSRRDRARGQDRRPTRTATPRPSASSASVTRKVDSSGNVCFAGDQLPGRQQVPAPPGPSRGRRRHRRDLHRRGTHPHPSRSATTAPANTAPSPTPAADPTASTPPDPPRHTTTGATPSHGYRDLTHPTSPATPSNGRRSGRWR